MMYCDVCQCEMDDSEVCSACGWHEGLDPDEHYEEFWGGYDA